MRREKRRRARAFEHAAQSWVAGFEAKYSRFRPGSLLSRINAAAGREWVEVDEEMERFLDLSSSLFVMSRGLLDVTALPLMRLWDYHAPVTRVPAEAEIASLMGPPSRQAHGTTSRGEAALNVQGHGARRCSGSWGHPVSWAA